MASPPTLDPITLLTAAAGAAFGPAVSAVAGPYAAIGLCAFLGALVALSGLQPMGALRVLLTIGRYTATSVMLSVAVEAGLVDLGLLARSAHWSLLLVAFGLAAVGDGWLPLARRAVDGLMGMIERRAGAKES